MAPPYMARPWRGVQLYYPVVAAQHIHANAPQRGLGTSMLTRRSGAQPAAASCNWCQRCRKQRRGRATRRSTVARGSTLQAAACSALTQPSETLAVAKLRYVVFSRGVRRTNAGNQDSAERGGYCARAGAAPAGAHARPKTRARRAARGAGPREPQEQPPTTNAQKGAHAPARAGAQAPRRARARARARTPEQHMHRYACHAPLELPPCAG